jgi:hypothetical protein
MFPFCYDSASPGRAAPTPSFLCSERARAGPAATALHAGGVLLESSVRSACRALPAMGSRSPIYCSRNTNNPRSMSLTTILPLGRKAYTPQAPLKKALSLLG